MFTYIYNKCMCKMDYQKIYNQIIERAKTRQLKNYKEKHHIIPKCLGGSNKKENLVELTAKEHFLCHMLLCEMYPKEYKLKHALFLMAIGKQKFKEKIYVINSRTYERLKKEYSQMLLGIKQSIKTKNKKSNSMLNVWKNKSIEEKSNIGKKRWETRKKNGTDKISSIQAKNISKSLKGRKITWDTNNKKPILQYDIHGNFIKEWSSIAKAEKQLKGDIKGMLAGRQKTAGGYIWKYKN